MNQLPEWAQWVDLIVRALTTVGIGAFVAYVAYGQLQTARHRVDMDLFDRRMAVYDEIRRVVSNVLRDGVCDNPTFVEYIRAGDRLPLLFRNEMVEKYNSIQKPLANLAPSLSTAENAERHTRDMDTVMTFLRQFTDDMRGYTRFAQQAH